jgi:uncharacterized protein YjcR
MARAPNVKVDKAYELFKQGYKLIDISKELDIPDGTVRRWKKTYNWNNERSDKNSERSPKKKGGQPGNKNSVGNKGGAPEKNKNSEKHGFLSKWLPAETAEIMNSIEQINPLDIIWNNIQLQYTAIIRAQNLMYVKDQADKTITQIARSDGDTSNSEKWEVQQAWDKQATFLQAQSRAMTTLNSMVKQYDEMLHNSWDLATEEQKARIAVLKSKVDDTNKSDTSLMSALLSVVKGVEDK